jgi:hypothetical protein
MLCLPILAPPHPPGGTHRHLQFPIPLCSAPCTLPSSCRQIHRSPCASSLSSPPHTIRLSPQSARCRGSPPRPSSLPSRAHFPFSSLCPSHPPPLQRVQRISKSSSFPTLTLSALSAESGLASSRGRLGGFARGLVRFPIPLLAGRAAVHDL